MDSPFDSELLEKLIPWINKPVAEHAITALTAGMEESRKAALRESLQQCWQSASERIDHRSINEEVVRVDFAQLTHFICKGALEEFERLKNLYNNHYTEGLRQSLAEYVTTMEHSKHVEERNFVSHWRIGANNLGDFRRRGGERLLLTTSVVVIHNHLRYCATTADLSMWGSLICFGPDECPELVVGEQVLIEFTQLSNKHDCHLGYLTYQVVSFNPKALTRQMALKRLPCDRPKADERFEELFRHLLQDHKQRNRLDVDNTIRAVTARSYSLSSVSQLNAIMVLSQYQQRYHLLVSQGQSLPLQAQLQVHEAMIPHMVETTPLQQSQLFYAWADSRNGIYLAGLQTLIKLNLVDDVLGVWRSASWHKAFLVRTECLTDGLVDIGTSLPCHIAPAISKLNAPLPEKVVKLSEDLNKISLIEDVSYLVDAMSMGRRNTLKTMRKFNGFRVKRSAGVLRQVLFDAQQMPKFKHTYRFTHCSCLTYKNEQYVIVNGFCDYERAMLHLSLNDNPPKRGEKIAISWEIEGSLIFLPAVVERYDEIHKMLELKWTDEQGMVKGLFAELDMLDVFAMAFKPDIHAVKLDMAVRNLILTHVPKVSVFVSLKDNGLALKGLTGVRYISEQFVDSAQRLKLDNLFSRQMLKRLAQNHGLWSDILFVGVKDGKIVDRHLLSEFDSYIQWLEPLRHLNRKAELYIFSIDVTPSREIADDAIVRVEKKYIRYYNPSKSAKLDKDLDYSLSIQLLDVTELMRHFIIL